MQAQSIVMLVDATPQVDASGASTGLRSLIERHMDKARWRLVYCDSVEAAQEHFQVSSLGGLIPELVVLNVDVQRGWPFCSTLKKSFASVPVIVVSQRLSKEVFNNHQKLDTRADAYHRLPDELDGLEISLSYFSSHKSETGTDEEGSSPRVKVRKGGRVNVPTGILQKLETTVAEQARALEDARREIEALEAERDAVADKNRRQVLELMALAPGGSGDGGAEAQALRERITTLEAQALDAVMREDELRQTRTALTSAKAELAKAAGRPDMDELVQRLQGEVAAARSADEELRKGLDAQAVELAALRTERDQLVQRQAAQQAARKSSPGMARPAVEALEEAREEARKEAQESADQLAKASVQLSSLATELRTTHDRRMQAEEALRRSEARATELEQKLAQRGAVSIDDLQDRLLRAEDRAEAAERAWSAAAARADQLQVFTQGAGAEIERLNQEKKSIDDALAMSRRLMREYATDAARKAEELKAEQVQQKELAERAEAAERRVEELTQSAEFDKSLVESLERELTELRSRTDEAESTANIVLEAELERRTEVNRALKGELELAVAARDAVSLELQQHKDDFGASKAELEQLNAIRWALSQELETKGQALQALLDEQAELSQRHATSSEAHAALAREHAEVVARLSELEVDLEKVSRVRGETILILEEHIIGLESRFIAVRDFARVCEARLIEAESSRMLIEDKLEAVLTELRSNALRGEVPPAMELPDRPTLPPDDFGDDDEDEDADEAEKADKAEAIGMREGDGAVAASDGTNGLNPQA